MARADQTAIGLLLLMVATADGVRRISERVQCFRYNTNAAAFRQPHDEVQVLSKVKMRAIAAGLLIGGRAHENGAMRAECFPLLNDFFAGGGFVWGQCNRV